MAKTLTPADRKELDEIMWLWGADEPEARLLLAIRRGERTGDVMTVDGPDEPLSPSIGDMLKQFQKPI